MTAIEEPARPVAGSLLSRAIALGRLSERIGRFDPRRPALDRILERMLLFSRMAEHLSIAAPRSPLMHAVLREAELGCLECSEWRRCRQWLGGHLPDDDYRDFCPNEGLFSVLPRQDNVNRPHAPE